MLCFAYVFLSDFTLSPANRHQHFCGPWARLGCQQKAFMTLRNVRFFEKSKVQVGVLEITNAVQMNSDHN